jgi:hypothetical protein
MFEALFLVFQVVFPFVRIPVEFDFLVEKFSKGSGFGVAVDQKGNQLEP